MGKKKQQAPQPPAFVADSEAAAFAQTGRKPENLEEQAVLNDDGDAVTLPEGEGTQPIPEEAKPGFFSRAIAAMGPGYCGFCFGPCTPDPRKTHRCARCRKEAIEKPEDAA